MRIIRAFFVSLGIFILVTGIVFAQTWEFIFPTIVTDESATARTGLPVMLGYGGQSLIDSGKIDADGLNTNMQVGTNDIKYMMSTTQVNIVLVSMPASAKVTADLYTNYAPAQTNFPIIVGDSGLVTIPDDANIELGNNFDVEIDGYIDTSVDAIGNNIVNKDDAFFVGIVDSNTIGAAFVNNTTTFQNLIVGDNVQTGMVDDASWRAQTFTTVVDQYVDTIELKMYRNAGATGTFRVSIKETVAGKPVGDDITDGTIDITTFAATPGTFVVVPQTGVILEAATMYAVVLRTEGLAVATIAWRIDTTAPPYAGGTYVASVDSGTTWAIDNTIDGMFAVKGSPTVLLATGIASGEHDIIVAAGDGDGDLLHFDGTTNSQVNVGAIHNSAGTLWVSLWWKLDNVHDATSTREYLWSKNIDATNRIYIYLGTNGKLEAFYQNGGVTKWTMPEQSGQVSWAADVWNHTILSISALNGARFITNGGAATTNADTTALYNGGDMVLGWSSVGPNDSFEGVIANVVVGTDDLTGGEEADLFIGVPPGDQTNYWYMNEGTGVNIIDYGTGGADGTAGASNTWITGFAPYNFGISVDGVGQSRVPLNGASVTDNANVWTLAEGNTMPYVDLFTIDVSSVEKLHYEPDTMIIGTAFAGTADAGTTTTLDDALLTQADDYWNNALLTIVTTTDTFAPQGETSIVTDFDDANDRLTFPALTAVVDAGDTYTVDFGTVVDETVNNIDGRITWGVNEDLGILYSEMQPFTDTTAAASADLGFNMPESVMPATWFAAGETLVNLPFYDSWNATATDIGMPVQTLYFWSLIGIALLVFMILATSTKSAFVALLGMLVIMFTGSSMTIVPMWIPFSILIVDIGILFLYRQVSY